MVLRRPNQQAVEVKTRSTKAKAILAFGAIVTAQMFSAGAVAQPNGYGTMPMPLYGQPRQINADPYKPSGEPNYRYQGGSGTRYQYDLSNPGDQIRYSTDVGGQIRDSVNVNPGVELDRGLGQVGGGIK